VAKQAKDGGEPGRAEARSPVSLYAVLVEVAIWVKLLGGSPAALDQVGRHGAGRGGPGEIDLATAGGRRGQVGRGRRGRRRLGGTRSGRRAHWRGPESCSSRRRRALHQL